MNDYPGLFNSVINVWRDVALAFAISGISGVVSHLHHMRSNDPPTFSLIAFLVDIGSAGLVGFIALMLCIEHQVSPWMTGPIVGMAAHAAPRLIFLGDKIIIKAVKKATGTTDNDSH